jgi:selenocysteine lyase/cysteine desulfurase
MNISRLRSEFPTLNEMVYIDIAYGNPLPNRARDAMIEFLSLQQREGVSVARSAAFGVVDGLREKFGTFVGASPSEVAFVKNTSEGLNIAASGIAFRRGDNVVLNELEHPNNTHCWLRLREKGVDVRVVRQEGGRLDLGDLERMVDDDTRVVAVSSTTNLGFRFDLERLGEICGKHSCLLVVDAIQSLGVEPLDVRSLGVDVLSSSAHKGLLGPHGIGFFYCSGELIEDMEPMSVAGTCYESSASGEKTLKKTAARFEGGNYNYAGVYGASAGLDLVLELGGAAERCLSLAEAFREGVRGAGCAVHDSPVEDERSHIVVFSHPSLSCEELGGKLERSGVRVSTHYGVVRASFAPFNDASDVEAAVEAVG